MGEDLLELPGVLHRGVRAHLPPLRPPTLQTFMHFFSVPVTNETTESKPNIKI